MTNSGQVAQGILQFESPVKRVVTDNSNRRRSTGNIDSRHITDITGLPLTLDTQIPTALHCSQPAHPEQATQGQGSPLTTDNSAISPGTTTNKKGSRLPVDPQNALGHGQVMIPGLGTVIDRGDNTCTRDTPPHADSAMAEELKAQLEIQTEATRQLQEQVEQAELCNELDKQEQEQQAWKATLEKLQLARENQQKAHDRRMADIAALKTVSDQAPTQLEWLQKRMAELQANTDTGNPPTEEETTHMREGLQDIIHQQRELALRATQLVKDANIPTELQALLRITQVQQENTLKENAEPQQALMDQLKAALMTKNTSPTGDWQKDVLKQFLINSSKTEAAWGGDHTKTRHPQEVN